jgi:hypothetical protein
MDFIYIDLLLNCTFQDLRCFFPGVSSPAQSFFKMKNASFLWIRLWEYIAVFSLSFFDLVPQPRLILRGAIQRGAILRGAIPNGEILRVAIPNGAIHNCGVLYSADRNSTGKTDSGL